LTQFLIHFAAVVAIFSNFIFDVNITGVENFKWVMEVIVRATWSLLMVFCFKENIQIYLKSFFHREMVKLAYG